MRQIMMLGEFYKRLLRLCDDQQAEDAHKLLDGLCEKELSFSLSAIASLPLSNLLEFLTDEQRFIMAEIVFMESEVLSALGEEDAAVQMRAKALPAILSAAHTHETAAYRYARVKMLEDAMPGLAVNDRLRLVQFYVTATHFDDAEDALYFCLDHGSEQLSPEQIEKIRKTGTEFYKELRVRSDGELAAGGFSREEIDEGLRTWALRF